MAVALFALTACILISSPAPAPTPAPPAEISSDAEPQADVPAPAPAPSETSAPPSTTAPPSTPPGPALADPEGQPPAPETSAPVEPAPAPFDRVELRDGGMVEGELVEFVPKSHMTIAVRGSEESRTFNWAQVEYVQRADGSREPISAGKPTIAELAAMSEDIEKKKKLGLGLAYGGYSTIPLSLIAWGGYAFIQEPEWLVGSLIMTSVTAGLLTAGGVIFFRARNERKELRKVILSATPTSHGGLFGVSGRF